MATKSRLWTTTAAVALALTAIIAAPAHADSGNPWASDQQSEMCQDMTGNWIMCDSQGGDGVSGGTAPAMQTCTSNFGCQKCFLSNNDYRPTCGIDVGSSGLCKCKEDGTSNSGCKEEGKCTYRP